HGWGKVGRIWSPRTTTPQQSFSGGAENGSVPDRYGKSSTISLESSAILRRQACTSCDILQQHIFSTVGQTCVRYRNCLATNHYAPRNYTPTFQLTACDKAITRPIRGPKTKELLCVTSLVL